MQSSYWLEIWVPPASYAKASRLLGGKKPGKARSILKLYERTLEDDPDQLVWIQMADHFQTKLSKVNSSDLSESRPAVWLDCHSDSICSFKLDPITLLQLGQDQFKACITCHSHKNEYWRQHIEYERAVVDISDIWIDPVPEGNPGAKVSVRLNDGTYWTASFVSYEEMNQIRSTNQEKKQGLNRYFAWQEQLILVEKINRDTIIKTIAALLEERRFEQAFATESDLNPESKDSKSAELSLCILHPPNDPPDIQALLGKDYAWQTALHHSYIQSSAARVGPESIQSYLSWLDSHHKALKKAGVLKTDISLHWKQFYQHHSHLELSSEMMMNLGKAGLRLQLEFHPHKTLVARCLG